jgi:glycosyltransferase involved in cell wall biosynthesis
MRVSVVISTYNSPRWLEKVLWGYSVQSHRDFEVVIADDGSTPETAALIERMREATGLAIKHVWQPDVGFRKSRILNKATLQVGTDYVIYTDGDCIPRRDFVEVHATRARPGHYLAGSFQRLPMATSEAITKEDIVSGACFRLGWLRRHGLPHDYKNVKLAVGPLGATLMNRLTPARANFKGGNGSAWLADILRINGFDEQMPYGGQDREFGVRLANAGVKPVHVRYDAIVIHLDHPRGYRDPAKVEANRRHRLVVQHERRTRTEHGIAQLARSPDT